MESLIRMNKQAKSCPPFNLGLIIFIVFSFFSSFTQPAHAVQTLSYRLTINPKDSPDSIQIQGTLSKTTDPIVDFSVLVNYGSYQSLNLVKDLNFFTPNGTALENKNQGPGRWQVQNPSSGDILFSYRLQTNRNLDLEKPGGGEMPHLTQKLFFTLGAVSFVKPAAYKSIPVQLIWNIPKDWKISTPWPTTERLTLAPSTLNLANNYIAAGTSKNLIKQMENFQFEIAWFGKGKIPKSAIRQFSKVFETAHLLFGEIGTPKYLLLLKPLAPPGSMEGNL